MNHFGGSQSSRVFLGVGEELGASMDASWTLPSLVVGPSVTPFRDSVTPFLGLSDALSFSEGGLGDALSSEIKGVSTPLFSRQRR